MSEIGLTGLKYLQDDVLSAGSTGKLFLFFLFFFFLPIPTSRDCLLSLTLYLLSTSITRKTGLSPHMTSLWLPLLPPASPFKDWWDYTGDPACCFSEFPLPLWSSWHCFWRSMCGIFSSTNQFSSLQKQHQISGSLTHLSVLRLTSILTLTTQS